MRRPVDPSPPARRGGRHAHGTLTRRGVITGASVALGLIGGAAAGRGATRTVSRLATPGATPGATPVATPFGNARFGEPPVRASQDGRLATVLAARPSPALIAGRTVPALTYEGGVPGPTLRVRPGDTLRIDLRNGLAQPTNLHVHGMHVSPRDNGDNVFLHVAPGVSFGYEYRLPLDHPTGLYWYHPHLHGDTEVQVGGGLAGAIVVEGAIDEVPGVAGLPERLFVLQSTELAVDGSIVPIDQQQNDRLLTLVNGVLHPDLPVRPGQTERWRLLNASADTFLDLQLDGHQLHQIGADGNPLGVPWSRDRVFLSPGERAEVLVQAGAAGRYAFRSLAWGDGFQAQNEMPVATLRVAGEPVTPVPLPTTLLPFTELTEEMVERRRLLIFEEPSQNPFTVAIDGKVFDPNRVDQTVPLGAIEEWTIRNTSPDWHPFHIHVNDFQVVAVDGRPVRPRSGQDTVGVPANGGEITFRTRFKDFSGKYVYHCHILGHEDAGMMGVVEVVE